MCVRSKLEMLASETDEGGMNNTKRINQQKVRLQKRQAMLVHSAQLHSQSSCSPDRVKEDALAVATAQYRQLLIAVTGLLERCQHSKMYHVLFHTTQPAHVVTMVAVALVAYLVGPRTRDDVEEEKINQSPFMNFIYLSSFMIHYGAQMWMTFVSGLSLYFALPRHTFGSIQRVLFPRYFAYNSFFSLITLILFVKLHPTAPWDVHVYRQVCVLVVCFLIELVILLYLTPPLLKLIAAKSAIEEAAGVGMEVGQFNMGPLANCPHYLGVHKAFRTVHMSVAMGNLVAIGCTTFHLWHLANKI